MDSFLIFFYILEQCYKMCNEDDLGGFLGSISPELWDDGKPMDMAVYNDWQTQNPNIEIQGKSDLKQIYDFLESYEKKFGYNFLQTKKTLIKNITNIMIQDAKRNAKNMKEKIIK